MLPENPAQTRVLIVDDEKANIDLLKDLYEMHGFRVISAQEGTKAIDIARQETPDLILLDVMMPGMDGYEVCRRLKSDSATRRLPVVMVTGLGDLDSKIKGLEAGADDFLTRPVNAAELLTRSRSLLRVKELNDELENAYQRFAGIASFTNRLLREFDPYLFEAKTSLGQLMEFLLGGVSNDMAGPDQALMLSKTEEGFWRGWHYFKENGGVSHRPVLSRVSDRDIDSVFGGRESLFANADNDYFPALGQAQLWGQLEMLPPEKNLVGYHSGEVAILAMDSGKRVGNYDAEVLSGLVATIHFFLRTVSSQIQEVERAFLYTISALARAAEMHDEDTGSHLVRVNLYSELLARALGCDEFFVRTIGYSAQMHDVGKLHVHPDILNKPGRLSAEQWEDVKLHTIYGVRILGEDPRLGMAREVALTHHEHWDGSGYPKGLAENKIPLSGRIVMMADIYDALRSRRPYKPPFSHEEAVQIITLGDDRLKPQYFDPKVLQIFQNTHPEFARIFEQNQERSAC
ncbi:MAG: response regulator [Desulfarculaceae bacterium]